MRYTTAFPGCQIERQKGDIKWGQAPFLLFLEKSDISKYS